MNEYSLAKVQYHKLRIKELTLKIGECNVNAIVDIGMRNINDGIVLFCRYDDRVHPYKVIVAWLEDEKLRYKIVCSRKEESYNDAKKNFEAARLTEIKIDQIDQDNVFEKNYCEF